MGVEQRKVVDAIGTSNADGHVILTIADHLPFDSEERIFTLQDKLNDYLVFIESGEIYDAYPTVNGRHLEISICFKHTPNERGLAFLEAAEKIVSGVGISLTYEIMNDGNEGA